MPQPRYWFDRRRFLQVGAAGVVGAALPVAARAADASQPGFGKAKSVLMVWLSGGLSQLDTLDPKPQAPAEVRGEFSTIQTAIPGVPFGEHTPRLAQQAGRWSIVRTLSTLSTTICSPRTSR